MFILLMEMISVIYRLPVFDEVPMTAPTKTYYLRLPADLSRELRLFAVRAGSTMRAEIIEAIRKYLAAASRESGT